jgi:hypothetical protein
MNDSRKLWVVSKEEFIHLYSLRSFAKDISSSGTLAEYQCRC